ncbi:MAG: HEAT repeat domain-containing protein, partial [Candidatus Omnitrophota bacterium]
TSDASLIFRVNQARVSSEKDGGAIDEVPALIRELKESLGGDAAKNGERRARIAIKLGKAADTRAIEVLLQLFDVKAVTNYDRFAQKQALAAVSKIVKDSIKVSAAALETSLPGDIRQTEIVLDKLSAIAPALKVLSREQYLGKELMQPLKAVLVNDKISIEYQIQAFMILRFLPRGADFIRENRADLIDTGVGLVMSDALNDGGEAVADGLEIDWLELELKASDVSRRLSAVKGLSMIDNDSAVRLLVRALGDVSPNVRMIAAAALAKFRSVEAVAPLLSSLNAPAGDIEDTSHYIAAQVAAVRALAAIKEHSVVSGLIESLAKPHSDITQTSLIFALSDTGDPRAYRALQGLVYDSSIDPVMRNRVQAALFEFKPSGSADGGNPAKEEAVVPLDTGGIDLREMPVTRHTGAGMLSAVVPGSVAKNITARDLEANWMDIEKRIQSGPMPYEQLKAHAISCCESRDGVSQREKLVSFISSILKLEEQAAVATAPELKEILVVLG